MCRRLLASGDRRTSGQADGIVVQCRGGIVIVVVWRRVRLVVVGLEGSLFDFVLARVGLLCRFRVDERYRRTDTAAVCCNRRR